ncbi:MAG: HAD family hydrolase [Pseudomonadota bacterium]
MDIRAIIFDKDGTLIDFAATFNPATARVLGQLCGDDTELLHELASVWEFDLATQSLSDSSVLVAGCGADVAAISKEVLKIDNVEGFGTRLDQMFGAICVETVKALPGTELALKILHSNGVVLGIGTNDAEENAVAQMETLKFRSFFERIFGADSGHGAKPGPGMVSAFVEACGLEPSQVMMVGDSLHDLEAGRAAGVVTCGVETGPAERSTLEKHADIVLHSIADLSGHLRISAGS